MLSPASGGDEQHNDSFSASVETLIFQMSAVYTSPETRGRGLAKSLIGAATEEARNQARMQGRLLMLSVVVYANNSAAISVYERCGFERGAEGPKLVYNVLKLSSKEELEMHFSGTSSQ
jgi:ribosomal protein S18 acetylase RimI-like enzyme